MGQICKNYEGCPIYNGILKDMKVTAANYRKMYCEGDGLAWGRCKRYQVKERTGVCPPDLLPNSIKSVETILKEMGFK